MTLASRLDTYFSFSPSPHFSAQREFTKPHADMGIGPKRLTSQFSESAHSIQLSSVTMVSRYIYEKMHGLVLSPASGPVPLYIDFISISILVLDDLMRWLTCCRAHARLCRKEESLRRGGITITHAQASRMMPHMGGIYEYSNDDERSLSR